ncbi:MAG TPA: lanthionine synthetase LanC family protein [Opitutaceae bacterium]
MTLFREQVLEAVRAVTIRSATVHAWFGDPSPTPDRKIRRALSVEGARAFLLFGLQSRLYNDFYTQGSAEPGGERRMPAGPIAGGFIEHLSRANRGTGCWHDGWEISEVSDGQLTISRKGLRLRVPAGDIRLPSGVSHPEAQGAVLLRLPPEQRGMSPGYYMAVGDHPLEEVDGSIIRVYWNLDISGAIPFVRLGTKLLNEAGIPFRLKVISTPTAFARCDAGVLYFRRCDFDSAAHILASMHAEIQGSLKPAVPAFTKTLRPGLALAENPPGGESFGLHRCQLLADALIRAHEDGIRSQQGRLEQVDRVFQEAGLNLDKPFLNPGSRDTYRVPDAPTMRDIAAQLHPAVRPRTTGSTFLDVARFVALRLVRECYRHEGRCSWMGTDVDDTDPNAAGRIFRSLGPEFYGGTGGIALFLAELHSACGDPEIGMCARGAIAHALAHADRIPSSARLGLYTGWLGIVVAAARVGKLLGASEITQGARELLDKWREETDAGEDFDIMAGAAGAICGLLVTARLLDNEALVTAAKPLADDLLAKAERRDEGWSWRSPGIRHRNLTGYSHGVAGVAHALLELYSVTGDPRYRDGARRAIAYERSWFQADAGNWPDFRNETSRGRRLRFPPAFTSTWCHGGPGIALSRLRAFQLLHEPELEAESRLGLATAARMIERWLANGLGNYSLCHGLCGNADILLTGHTILNESLTDIPQQALDVAETGRRRHARQGAEWPCGTGGGESPNLMLGLAGIGHFYLRLHDRKIPSVLLLVPSDFGSVAACSPRV